MEVPPIVKHEMDEILAKNMPRVTEWKAVPDLLLQHNPAWRATLEPSMLLVHHLNRSGLAVSGHKCHSKAAYTPVLAAESYLKKFIIIKLPAR